MKRSLFTELKRRHVYRVAVAYAVVGWLLIEVATQVFPVLHMPEWTEQLVVLIILIGFPVALVFAWAFELTPEGVRRTEPADSPEARRPEQHRQVGRTLDFVIIGVLVVAVAVMAWQRWGPRATVPISPVAIEQPAESAANKKEAAAAAVPASPASPATPTTAIPSKSIAVLPFENLSEDKANAYFADGMQDLVLTKLAEIGELKVISRTSTAKYASRPDDLKTIAAQLGVAHILEGSVQKAGNSVLINVQLIDAQTDAHLWAQAYTRTLENVFGVEGEVAEKIADALNAKLSPAETKRLATALSADAQANDLFLRAEYYSNRGQIKLDAADLRQSIPLYRQALARVPDFALAHAELSVTESLLVFIGGGKEVRQLDEDVREEAERALQLAPNLAESHLAIGYSEYWGRSDYDAALKSFAEALRIRPNDAAALLARGFVLRRQGKFDEAVDAFQQALDLDPRNSIAAGQVGQTYIATGRYVVAERALLHALALDPGNEVARLGYALSIAFRTGELDRALIQARGDSVLAREMRVIFLTWQRNYRDALAVLEGIPDTPDNFGNFVFSKEIGLADLHRLSGDTDQTRAHFAKALPELRTLLSASADRRPLMIAQVLNAIAAAELGLGNTTAAMTAIEKSLTAGDGSGDHYAGPGIIVENASLYAEAGRADKAVPLLARALATPGIGLNYSPVLLWIDPAWDPIRKDAGFQALLKQYASYRPAVAPDAAAP